MKYDDRNLHILLHSYLDDEKVRSMENYIQHGTTTTYAHCLSVVRTSLRMADRLPMEVDRESLAVGALLHDFYLYDWHISPPKGVLHGYSHPHAAARNAWHEFHVSPAVQHIIRTHMWPLTLRFVPRTREAAIVCIADKAVSTAETLSGFGTALRTGLRKITKRGASHG